MIKTLRDMMTGKTAGRFLYGMARLYCRTLRLTVEDQEKLVDYLERGGRALVCLWHQQLLTTVRLFPSFGKFNPCVMISMSRDGDMASRMVEAGGLTAVRGSSSRGGIGALKEMIRKIKKGCLGAHVLDGPRGPAGVVKPGAIMLAHMSQAAVFPVVVIADRAWYLKSWDRFMIPKPFSRAVVRFLPKIELPETMNDEEIEQQRRALERAMRPYLKEI